MKSGRIGNQNTKRWERRIKKDAILFDWKKDLYLNRCLHCSVGRTPILYQGVYVHKLVRRFIRCKSPPKPVKPTIEIKRDDIL